MKKLVSCLSLLLFPLFVGAQDFGVWEHIHYANSTDPISALYRKIVQTSAANQKLPWAKLVEKQIYAAEPHGLLGSNNWDHVPSLADGVVPQDMQQKVAARTKTWQESIYTNPAIKWFRVSVPDAKAVANLPAEHVHYITGFLQAPITVSKQNKRYTPVSVEAYKRFLVRVTLKPSKDAWPVHLIFNCFSKQMYVSYPWFEVPGVTFEKLK